MKRPYPGHALAPGLPARAAQFPPDPLPGALPDNPYPVLGALDNALGPNWVNVRRFGAVGDWKTDDTAALQKIVAMGRPVYFPYGGYVVSQPIVWNPFQVARGDRGRIAGADSGVGGGSVIIGSPSFSNPAGYPMDAVFLFLDASVTGFANCNGFNAFDLTIDGSQLPAGTVDGWGFYGAAQAHSLERCAAQNMTGNGFNWLGGVSGAAGAGNPDGGHLRRCLAQNNALWGFLNTPEDSVFDDCHAQGNDSGWLILGNNAFFTRCRADTSKNANGTGGDGFQLQPTSDGTNEQPVTLAACGTEYNFGNGYHLLRRKDSANIRSSVMLNGCVSQQDGVNGGAGGGSFSAFIAEGLGARLYISGSIAVVGNTKASQPCPDFGLTARATSGGSFPGSPAAVKMTSGRIQGNTAASNNEPSISNYLVASAVDTT